MIMKTTTAPLFAALAAFFMPTISLAATAQFDPPGGIAATSQVGTGPETLGEIRDKANAAMPSSGGKLSGNLNLNYHDLQNVGTINAAALNVTNLEVGMVAAEGASLQIGGTSPSAIFSRGSTTFSSDAFSFQSNTSSKLWFSLDNANGLFLNDKLMVQGSSILVGTAEFNARPDFRAGLSTDTRLVDPDGTSEGNFKGLISTLNSLTTDGSKLVESLTQETTRAKEAENSLMPKAGGTFTGDVWIGDGKALWVPQGSNLFVGGSLGLVQEGDGIYLNASQKTGVSVTKTSWQFSATTFDNLSKGAQAKGVAYFCTDCKLNGKTGVMVVYNGSAWTGFSGEDITK